MLCVEENVQVVVSMHSPQYDEYLSEKDKEKLNDLIGECKGVSEWSIGAMNGAFCIITIQKDENYEKDIQKIKDFIEGCKKFIMDENTKRKVAEDFMNRHPEIAEAVAEVLAERNKNLKPNGLPSDAIY